MVDWLGTVAFLALTWGLVWLWIKACIGAYKTDDE